ncbi:6-carboxytetrahydropterin synthase QueD [candidate division KSB1 bacterium]|nr:6-carboxytetrahydropterin synthase QueD [candidate division KSB1 bacterium]
MYKISVKTDLAAAHQLVGYNGSCRRLHGHNWKIKVQIGTHQLDEVGIGYDFRKMKQLINSIVDNYDHQFLNEIPPFDTLNPTSENLARFIYDEIKNKLPQHIEIISVEVMESDRCSVIYTED